MTVFPAPTSSLSGVPRSGAIAGLAWIGEAVPCSGPKGDTFPWAWLDDDTLVSSAGDPVSNSSRNGLDARHILGTPPELSMRVTNELDELVGWGGDGPKPTGMAVVDGTVYLAAQNVPGHHTENDAVINWGHGYDAHVFASCDAGVTWTPRLSELGGVMFPGRSFGAPAFVAHARGRTAAPDGYVYAISGVGWDNGDRCRLGRVPAGAVLDRSAWEFVGGVSADGEATWTADLEASAPVLVHPGYLGAVEMVYLEGLDRYLLCGWANKVKANPDSGSELVLYDAPRPWGPFTLVHHEDPWETAAMNPYNPRVPLKWYDHDANTGWLLFSGSWRDEGSSDYYRAHARPFRLLRGTG